MQQSVTTSSIENEYIAAVDILNNIVYILFISIGLPIVINIDSLGAIHIFKNTRCSVHTKHININYHYIQEYTKKMHLFFAL